MGFIIIYITHKDIQDAKRVVNPLLEKRLIACANLIPIESLYRWKGKIEHENEVVSIVKTRKDNWDKVRREVKRMHPYDVPCIMKIEVEANHDYEQWINDETLFP